MTLEQATDLLRQTLVLTLLLASPMLIMGMLVGVLVSLFQAVTQIQEQTLTFIPKITAMFLSAVVVLPWLGHRLLEYAGEMFRLGPTP